MAKQSGNLPEVILFDLDGTLLDNMETVVEAYHEALIELKYPSKEKKFIASLAGLSTHNTARAMGIRDEDLDKVGFGQRRWPSRARGFVGGLNPDAPSDPNLSG